MKLFPRAVLALAVLTLAGCPSQPPATPRITEFKVDAPQVPAGTAVTLSYQVENASEVTISDQFGNELERTGDAKAGTVSHTPNTSTFYILRAKGDGGRDSAFVQVAVAEPLKDAFLVAVPPEIDSGQEVELLYSVLNATQVSIKGAQGDTVETKATSGVARLKPARSTTYTLTAQAGESTLEATAKVSVRPVISSFTATPGAARVAEKMVFAWTSAAGKSVTLKEKTLGELFTSTDAGQVGAGNFEWTIPSLTYPEGFPFFFTLEVTSDDPALTVSKTLNSFLGEGPRVNEFVVPAALTTGRTAQLSWKTTNAQRLQVRANGHLIYEPQAGGAAVSNGSLNVPSVTQDTTFELVAWSFNQLSVSASKKVVVVKPPKVTGFALPATVSTAGSPANATWTTENSSQVSINVRKGGSVFFTNDPARTASGNVDLFPATRTTFELVARNAAGDEAVATATVEVGTPALIGATPPRSASGAAVQINYDLPTAIEVIGVPFNLAQPINNTLNFVDLASEAEAQTLSFSDPDEAVSQISGAFGFRFPFRGETFDKFWVSTNGFVSLADTVARPTNSSLAVSNTLPPMFAPFWDDLELGAGSIYYMVEGNSFPRRLIVQWTGVSIKGDSTSSLTFQVQLFESGEFKFLYQTLTDANARAQGQSATVGVNLRYADFYGQHSFDSGVLSDGLELSWFNSTTLAGNYSVSPKDSANYTVAWKSASGQVYLGVAGVEILRQGAVVIAEAMPVPDAAFPSGGWIELHNPNSQPFDLSGMTLSSAGSTSGDTFSAGTVIPPKGYLLLGYSTDTALTGGANVQLVLTDVPLAATDSLKLSIGSTTITSLDWTNATAGTSVQFAQLALNSSGTAQPCTRAKSFNANMNLGTPGADNESCFDYLPMPITGQYEDISADGIELLSAGSPDGAFGTFPLPVPFKYFGTSYDEISLSFDGFATLGAPLTATSYSNTANPSTSAPNGMLAPFWDDLYRNTTGKLLMARRPTYTVIAWHDFKNYSEVSSLHFQLKLFDDGVIEFHYGAMDPISNLATGSSATAWLEKPEGGWAQRVHYNSAGGLAPHTGWRFTPKQ